MSDDISEEDVGITRKLASFQKIHSLTPIPQKDFIVSAGVMGYKTTVKKDDFKVGDWCVFFEVDSWLDVSRPEFAFLKPRAKICADGIERARITAMKLGESYSEGLAIALKDIPWLKIKPKEDLDLTAEFDVLKYQRTRPNQKPAKPLSLKRRIFRKLMSVMPRFVRAWVGIDPGWPGFCPPQTDEPKLKSGVSMIRKMQGLECYVSLKMDGQSLTAMKRRGKLTVCSRTQEKRHPDNDFVLTAKKYKLDEVLPEGYAIQGERLAGNVQKNRLGVEEPELHIFNVFKDGKQLPLDEALKFCEQIKVPHVPIIERFVMGEDFDLEKFTISLAKMKYERTGHAAEGVVVRACDLQAAKEKTGWRLSCKVINPVYETEVKQKQQKK